jgi:hypothetical protein
MSAKGIVKPIFVASAAAMTALVCSLFIADFGLREMKEQYYMDYRNITVLHKYQERVCAGNNGAKDFNLKLSLLHCVKYANVTCNNGSVFRVDFNGYHLTELWKIKKV